MREFATRVVGVTYSNRGDGSSRQEIIKRLRPGNLLYLIPEPDNPYDPGAIAVWASYRRWFRKHYGQIGYIDRDLNESLGHNFDEGRQVYARVKTIIGGSNEKPNLGVNIQIHISDGKEGKT